MYVSKKHRVCFFTHEVDVSFVLNEIRALSDEFKIVDVFSFKIDGEYSLPKNVNLKKADYSNYSTSKTLLFNLPLFIGLSIIELFSTAKYIFSLKLYFKSISELLRSIYLSKWLINQDVLEGGQTIFYSFWFNQWATVLSILVKRGNIKEYYSRVHGTDLYEYRVPRTMKIPFREFQLKKVKLLFSVSEKGAVYLKGKYPKYVSKIKCTYLGTKDMGEMEYKQDDYFTIVSCANVRNIKRVHCIPEVLEQFNFKIKWIHIGNENLNSKDLTIPLYKTNKEKLKSKLNIETQFKGVMKNEEVLNFYKTNKVDLFISLSETEGLPVSMMEAISFGIPIISTDVGGCNEIVNERTGILIPKDFKIEDVASQIEGFKEKACNVEFRKGVRLFCEANFDGKKNFDLFINQISSN